MIDQMQQASQDRVARASGPERRSPRRVLEKLAYVHMEPDSGAIVLNVSEGGLAFHAVGPVLQTGTIRLWFSLKPNQRVEAAGELAWTDASKKTGGLRFTHLSEGAREQIIKWLGPGALPAAKTAGPEFSSSMRGQQVTGEFGSTHIGSPSRSALPVEVPAEPAEPVATVQSSPASPPSPTPPTSPTPLASPAPRSDLNVANVSELPSASVEQNPLQAAPQSATQVAAPSARSYFDLTASQMSPKRPPDVGAWRPLHWEAPVAQSADLNSPPRFARGFVAGILVSVVVVVASLGFGYYQPLRNLLMPVAQKAQANPERQSETFPPPPPPISSFPAATSPAKNPAAPVAVAPEPTAEVPQPEALDSANKPEPGSALSGSGSSVSAPSRSASGQSNDGTQPPRVRSLAERHSPARSVTSIPADTQLDDSETDLAAAERYLHGPSRNTGAAIGFLWAAVEKGNSTAEIMLADLYSRGDGIAKNCAQARVLLTAAAEKGNVDARQKVQELNGRGCF